MNCRSFRIAGRISISNAAGSIKMPKKRFPGSVLIDKTIEQVRGMEGLRVRKAYEEAAAEHGIDWTGRNYDQDNWFRATAANRALSAANACLYGVCHAAIVSAGYAAGIGFVHTGKLLSFVCDVADLYKTALTVPVAFRLTKIHSKELERQVRMECRKAFHEFKLMSRILPDIEEVLHVGDDCRETAEELEGRAVSLAGPAPSGGLPGESEPTGQGRTVETGDEPPAPSGDYSWLLEREDLRASLTC
jgi:CRISP-associated protein Cas1